jgi:cell division protein FtsL
VVAALPALRPATLPGHAPSTRPARARLEVVAPRRRFRVGPMVALSAFIAFGIAIALVVCQVLLVQGQQRLDHLDTDMATADQHYDELRLQVAQLSAPDRIVDAATDLGMAPPDTITYLTPSENPDG